MQAGRRGTLVYVDFTVIACKIISSTICSVYHDATKKRNAATNNVFFYVNKNLNYADSLSEIMFIHLNMFTLSPIWLDRSKALCICIRPRHIFKKSNLLRDL